MGNSESSSSKSKRVLQSRFDLAAKTGVLNLSDQDIKPNSVALRNIGQNGFNIKIKTFDVSGNNLKALPPEIFALINVKTFIAAKCSIQKITDFHVFDKLTALNLEHNDIEEDVISGFHPVLVKLNLSYNHMRIFPISLANLVNLQELSLNSNRLTNIAGIECLVSIISLELDDNLLTELIIDWKMLNQLKYLSVKNNKLSKYSTSDPEVQSIPSDLFLFTNMDRLDLNGNVGLNKSDVLNMNGVDVFMERRRKSKEKSLKGGAMTEHSLFGLE